MLLAAIASATLRPKIQAAFTGFILVAWTAGLWPILVHSNRPGAAYRALASEVGQWAGPDDLVLVHSIPSGVIGLSRYLERDLPLASWVEPLGLRRVPEDLERVLAGRRRVALVQVHNLAQPSPAEPWLRKHARLAGHKVYDGRRAALSGDVASLSPQLLRALEQDQLVEVLYFEPTEGAASFAVRR
jgi:hypothetical protein